MVACDVTLDDLDSVIAAAGEQVQAEPLLEEDEREDDDTHCETEVEEQEPLNVSPGPATSLNLSLSDNVAVNFAHGFYIGEII